MERLAGVVGALVQLMAWHHWLALLLLLLATAALRDWAPPGRPPQPSPSLVMFAPSVLPLPQLLVILVPLNLTPMATTMMNPLAHQPQPQPHRELCRGAGLL